MKTYFLYLMVKLFQKPTLIVMYMLAQINVLQYAVRILKTTRKYSNR